MNTQQIQNTFKNVQRTIGSLWLWLGIGILFLIAALAVNNARRPAVMLPITGSPVKAQTVPDAAAQGVANYLQAHSVPFVQTVQEAEVQSVLDYLRLHGNDLSSREYDLGERYGVTP